MKAFEGWKEVVPKTVGGGLLSSASSLTAVHGFVLSLVDATLTVQDIIDVSGREEDVVYEALFALQDAGFVDFHPSAGGGQDDSALNDDELNEISKAYAQATGKDHRGLLNLGRAFDKTMLRKAYLEASKRYHPDKFFAKELGDERAKLEFIFAGIKSAYAALQSEALAKVADEKPQTPKNSETPTAQQAKQRPTQLAPSARKSKISREELEKRREELRKRRLSQGNRLLKNKPVLNVNDESRAKGEERYTEALALLKKGETLAALRVVKIGLGFDPKNRNLLSLESEIGGEANLKRAQNKWKDAETEFALGQAANAGRLAAEAFALAPDRSSYAIKGGLWLLEGGETAAASDLVRAGVEKHPKSLDLRLAHVSVLATLGEKTAAIAILNKARALDADDDRVRSWEKKLIKAK